MNDANEEVKTWFVSVRFSRLVYTVIYDLRVHVVYVLCALCFVLMKFAKNDTKF